MRYMIYADPHWSVYSSILRSRGNKYSTRLENLIQTIQWVEDTAINQSCDYIICLGDFFDKSELNAEEISALQEIKWTDIQHLFIAGNHEMGRSNLEFTSSHLFNLCPHCELVNEPQRIMDNNTRLVLLPYVLERDRKPLNEYLQEVDTVSTMYNKTIVLSHNDIKDMQMGQWKSTEGFTIDEITNNCNLFINGHLHNAMEVTPNIINLGNITGQNFSENAIIYPHQVMILDTDAGCFDFMCNPYALNFYKLDFSSMSMTDIEVYFEKNPLKTNSVVSLKVDSDCINDVKNYLSRHPNVIESKVIVNFNPEVEYTKETKDLSIDHIDRFKEYIKAEVGTSDKILEELDRITGN